MKGLFMKEWFFMRGWAYAVLIFSVLLTFIIPISLTIYFSDSLAALNGALASILFLGVAFSIFIPALILMASLGKEAERPDIWLHSPSSIFTLFGVKALFASLVGAVNMIISAVFFTFLLMIELEPFQLALEETPLRFWFIFFTGLFLIALILMCIGLLFRVIYLVMKPYTGRMTKYLTFGALLLFVWIIDKITNSSPYQKISTFGKIGEASGSQFSLGEDSLTLWVDESLFYIGETFLSIGFASLLFIGSALLFEKKVRL